MKKSKARKLFDEGFEHHNNGRYDEAINSYTKSMKLSQSFMWAYIIEV